MSIKYEKLDPITHIHKRPDMYIGSLKPRNQTREWLTENEKMVENQNIKYSDGLLRIFIEALSNAIDNVWRSYQANIRCTKIKININKETGETSIWNDGLHIPIEMHKEENIYNPELIFGHLLSGSNMDDTEERLSSGRNGLGIKLLNVFSKKFRVEIGDPIQQKIYEQTWHNNMREKEEPKIKTYRNKNGFTMIEWIPDFSKFNMIEYDSIILSLYEKNCMNASMITRLPIFFNEKKYNFKNFVDYVRLYMPTDEKFECIYIGANDSSEYKTQIVIASNPYQEYKEIGFINGIYTMDGGSHLDPISSELWKQLMLKFNKSKVSITSKDLKPFFMIFVNAWAPNPEFSSQSKTKLLAPATNFNLEVKYINQIMKWKFVEKINDIIRSKELLSLKKSEKKQRGYKKIDGLDHANLAGSKHSKDCTLILCEGLSAKTYAVKGIDVGFNGKKGRDFFGIYALRGKLLNVRNANIKSISNNKEICDIIQALNIHYDMDYMISENKNTLQYGKIMILTDADEDGHHISSLIINLFHKLFPSILNCDPSFIWYMMTPIAKIFYSPNQAVSYYNEMEYHNALEESKQKKLKIKYYKGLGTSSDAEIKETFGQKVVQFVKDEQTDEILDKVFHKSMSNDRKEWLGSYDISNYKLPENSYTITEYINQELIKFSMEDCCRSIPNIFDGLKKSQRKILYSVFKKKLNHDGKSMKVAQLAGFCAETSNYHHGEQCLYDTIIKMSHDFPGSNNIPYFEKDGQFGSRSYGGKDAANARYIFTKCALFTRLLFPEIDDHLLDYTFDDNDRVEPDFYLPILPTILGNGCTAGIGTGWSCSVPCHDFLSLASHVKIWLQDPLSFTLDINPFYNYFKGSIEKLDNNRYKTTGIINKIDHKTSRKKSSNFFEITELPIGLWTNKYKEELEIMLENKKLKSLKNYSTPDSVHFIIEPNDEFIPTLENMKLISYISSTNMVLFTENKKLVKFNHIQDIFVLFCTKRLDLYYKRKDYQLKLLNQQFIIDKNKKRFIQDVESQALEIFKIPEKQIIDSLVQNGYDPDPRVHHDVKNVIIESDKRILGHDLPDSFDSKDFNYLLNIPMKDVCLEKINDLSSKISKLENDIKILDETNPSDIWINEIDKFISLYSKYHIGQ